jgi:hypothetical protein
MRQRAFKTTGLNWNRGTYLCAAWKEPPSANLREISQVGSLRFTTGAHRAFYVDF